MDLYSTLQCTTKPLMCCSHQYRLNRVVLRNCLKLSKPHARSPYSSSNEFQTVRLAIEKAFWRPYVLSRQRWMTSWCPFVKCWRSWEVTSDAGVIWLIGA